MDGNENDIVIVAVPVSATAYVKKSRIKNQLGIRVAAAAASQRFLFAWDVSKADLN